MKLKGQIQLENPVPSFDVSPLFKIHYPLPLLHIVERHTFCPDGLP